MCMFDRRRWGAPHSHGPFPGFHPSFWDSGGGCGPLVPRSRPLLRLCGLWGSLGPVACGALLAHLALSSEHTPLLLVGALLPSHPVCLFCLVSRLPQRPGEAAAAGL